MAQLQESYEHIGEVDIFVKDMHQVWEAGREADALDRQRG